MGKNRHACRGDAARVHLIEHGGGGLAAGCAHTPTAHADDVECGVGDSRLVKAKQLLHRFGRTVALVHEPEHRVVAVFRADIQMGQTLFAQLAQFRRAFFADVVIRLCMLSSANSGKCLRNTLIYSPIFAAGKANGLEPVR